MRINWLAILVAVIAQQVLGFIWYSRALFAESWMAGIGKRPEDLVPTPGPFILAIIAAVLLPIGMSWILEHCGVRGLRGGLLVGLGVGVAASAPAVIVHEAFLGFPAAVLVIDGGKEIITSLLVGVILGAWPRGAVAAH
jgi:Protein of unknown function (DUF1761)